MTPEPIAPSKLAAADAFRAAGIGLRTRRLRSILSALGIMIGIGAMVAVLGLSESSKSDLIAQLDRLGTNMLQVQAGTGIGLGPGELPDTAPAMVTRIDPVETVAAIADIDSARVYKNDLVPEGQTGGLSVLAAETNLLQTLQGSMADGFFLDEATPDYPVTVLGSVAAERLVRRRPGDEEREAAIAVQRHSALVRVADLVDRPGRGQAQRLEDLLRRDPVGGARLVLRAPRRVRPPGAFLARLGRSRPGHGRRRGQEQEGHDESTER